MCMQLGEIKKYFCHRMTVWKNKKIFGYNHLKHLKCIIILWTMEWGSWHCTGDRDQEHPHGKERQKSKMAVWEALQIAVKRREAKSKGEKERYKHLNRPLSLLDTLLKMYANSLLDKEWVWVFETGVVPEKQVSDQGSSTDLWRRRPQKLPDIHPIGFGGKLNTGYAV